MLSKTLSFNRGLIIQLVRQVGWISAMYTILLFLALPLQLMMAASRPQDHYLYRQYFINATSFFDVVVALQIVFLFIIPTLMAVFIFRYLQSKLAADFIHSLPISRVALFAQTSMTGIILLLLPLIFNGLLVVIIGLFVDASNLFTLNNFLYWLAISSLYNVFMFFVATLIGMLVGMSVLQAALVYITVFFPAGITVLFIANLDFFLYGISINHYISDNLIRLVPFVRLGNIGYEPLTAIDHFWYIALTLTAVALAVLVYRQRKVEAATQAIAFRSLRPIFLYGVTFCSLLLGGLYFGAIQDEQLAWILFGYGFFSLLGYIIAQMILNKSWQIFDRWRGYLAFVVAMLVIGAGVQFDFTGFEKRVPSAEQVVEVSFYGPHHYFAYYHKSPGLPLDDMGLPFGIAVNNYQERANIEQVIKLHEQLITDKLDNNARNRHNSFYTSRTQFNIEYKLSSGRTLVREYVAPATNYQEHLRPLMESVEYKQNVFPVLRVHDISDLETITFRSYHTSDTLIITDRQMLQQIHTLIQREVLKESYDDMIKMSGEPWAHIEYSFNNRNIYLTVPYKKNFHELDWWLEQNKLLEEARYTAADVREAYLLLDNNQFDSGKNSLPEHTLERSINDVIRNFPPGDLEKYALSNNLSYIEITDESEIELLLRLADGDNAAAVKYIFLVFFYENDYPVYMMLDAKNLPADLKF